MRKDVRREHPDTVKMKFDSGKGTAGCFVFGENDEGNRMLRDIVISNGDYTMSRTAMVFDAIDQICYAFDLGHPVWLDKTIEEFKRHDKARFTQDNFIESIDFDYLEIQVLEE